MATLIQRRPRSPSASPSANQRAPAHWASVTERTLALWFREHVPCIRSYTFTSRSLSYQTAATARSSAECANVKFNELSAHISSALHRHKLHMQTHVYRMYESAKIKLPREIRRFFTSWHISNKSNLRRTTVRGSLPSLSLSLFLFGNIQISAISMTMTIMNCCTCICSEIRDLSFLVYRTIIKS